MSEDELSGRAIVEHSAFSLPRISGLPQDHVVNLTIRELELEFKRTFNLMGRGASGPSDLPELTDVLLSLEVHTPNFTSMMFDEYVRRQANRNVVSGSLNLIEAEVWHIMRELDKLVGFSRDSIERLARTAAAGIDARQQLSTRDSVWAVSATVLELESYLEDLLWVRDRTLQAVSWMARAIEDWIAKVGTLAQIPGADGQMSSRGNEMVEEFQKRFSAIREHELDIFQADGKVVPARLNQLDADLDEAVAFGFERFGGVQFGESHDDARMRRYVTANLAKWQQQHGLGAVLVEMKRSDQKLLDNYNGDEAKLLGDLLDRGYYKTYGVAQTQAFRDLIHEAWRLNIPTRAIDTAYRPSFEHARLRVSDPYWVTTFHEVRESLPPDTPVLVVAGGAHSSFGAHVGIPTIDEIYSAFPDLEQSFGRHSWQSDPGVLAYDPGPRAGPEPERQGSYTEREYLQYLEDSETFKAIYNGATIVVNPPNPTGP